MRLADYVIDYFNRLCRVDHVFLLPGGGSMYLVDAVGKNKNVKAITCLHEQSAAIAAAAYAQYNNYSTNVGLCIVTTGPGGTNAITAVAAAYIDSVPLVVISGQVKTQDLANDRLRQKGVQEVNIVKLVKSITKYAVTVTDKDDIFVHLKKAAMYATMGRKGPVWIDIPLDIQNAEIDTQHLEDMYTKLDITETTLNPSKIKEIASSLACAKQPVILVGNGARDVVYTIQELASYANIPMLATWKIAECFTDVPKTPFYYGRPGSIASRYANLILQNSDLLLCIGARLDLPQIGYDYTNFAPKANKIVVDVDNEELLKLPTNNYQTILANAKTFVTLLEDRVRGFGAKEFYAQQHKVWNSQCAAWVEKYPIISKKEITKYRRSKKKVDPYYFIHELSKQLTGYHIIVPGSSGACAEITMQALEITDKMRVQNFPGLGSMGFGIPNSIGACIASRMRETICIIGDGGLQHNLQELQTIITHELPIKIFVWSNEGYGSIVSTQDRFFNGRHVGSDKESGLVLPNLYKVAMAYGFPFYKASCNEEVRFAIAETLRCNCPVICEVVMDKGSLTKYRTMSQVGSDGKIVSSGLENLWPFLPEDEMKENML